MNIQRTLAIISLLLLTACGGGGGGSTSAPATTTIKGVASKGLITNGTVNIFALNADGTKGTKLGTGTTDDIGNYSISFASYSGPVVVEASGDYLDEATGVTKTVPASVPLRAAIANASGTVSIAVTPLTDMAVRQAGTLTAQKITTANTLLSETFKIDIISTIPAAPTVTAFQSSATTQAQKDYALVLAAVSQHMQTSGSDLATTLSSLSIGITSAGISAQTASTITAAATTFVANTNNRTSVTEITGSSLQTIGSTARKMTLALQGTSAASVKSIQATITLPAGVSLRADATGKVFATSITATGSAANSYIDGNYIPATDSSPATLTVGLISETTLSSGDVIDLNIDLALGGTSPQVTGFTILSSKLAATGGAVVNGASLALR